jgi:hypothetical protein
MNMKTETFVSVQEYLKTSYEPDCDYVDGEVQERNVGERDHSILQREVIFSVSVNSYGRLLFFRNNAYKSGPNAFVFLMSVCMWMRSQLSRFFEPLPLFALRSSRLKTEWDVFSSALTIT